MAELPLSRSGRSAREVATQVARDAGDILLSHFHSRKRVRRKGRGNLG